MVKISLSGRASFGAFNSLMFDVLALEQHTLPLTCPHPRASSPAPSAPNSGPSDTLYEHGCFRCILNFPRDYPHSPPSMYFSPPIWHPNVHEDGKVSFQHFFPHRTYD